MKRVIISGGGTREVISIRRLLFIKKIAAMTEAEFLYIGTERGLEASIVPKEGLPFRTLPVQG